MESKAPWFDDGSRRSVCRKKAVQGTPDFLNKALQPMQPEAVLITIHLKGRHKCLEIANLQRQLIDLTLQVSHVLLQQFVPLQWKSPGTTGPKNLQQEPHRNPSTAAAAAACTWASRRKEAPVQCRVQSLKSPWISRLLGLAEEKCACSTLDAKPVCSQLRGRRFRFSPLPT